MSEEIGYRRINDEQPPPKSVNGDAIWDLVVSDMIERDKAGLQKYGTRLQAGNGRDALVDAYQEALDLSVYLRQAIEEQVALRAQLAAALEAQQKAERFIESHGYRRCDIPACNCHSWHGGHAMERLHEIADALPYENGRTILARVQSIVQDLDSARAEVQRLSGQVEEMRHRIRKARQIISTAPYSPEAIDAAMGARGEGQE